MLHEPLLAFLLAGAGLFVVYRELHPPTQGRGSAQRIEVTADDLRQMSVGWMAQGQSAPTPEQKQHLLDAWVREEILFREALALGLDKNDTIVKRRMVQKMEFLAEDLSDLREPTSAELEAWFTDHTQRFAQSPRVTFRHLYFSPDHRDGEGGARAAAAREYEKLRSDPDAAVSADAFMGQDYYPERSPDDVAKDFGPPFAAALFGLEPGSWQGPLESGLGWHLVFVDARMAARVPAYAEVEAEVRKAWVAEQREEFRRKAFDAMKARYEIVLPAEATQVVPQAQAAP